MKQEEYKLQIKNVNKFYKLENKTTFQALENVSVSFKKGELVSIIGESGSGKSTLMNLIGGLDSDFEGEIVADGVSLHSLSDKELDKYRKNKVGFVFQSFNLIPHLSILDNVTIALTLSNEKENVKVEKATRLLERLGLKDQLKKKPNQLSGGQKQRVAIARALINDPEIILADEPTGALDSGTTAQILEILKEIADDGKLVIMVTHSEKVASISSRIVEISDGRIVRDEQKADYKRKRIKKEQQIEKSQSVKQNLSLFSALRLSLHNMWASKTKNLLMAFGVSISILSMILMLSFGSGLTDYISSLADEYNNPLYVSVTKKKTAENGSGSPMGGGGFGFLNPLQFEQEEIDNLLVDVNKLLDDNNYPQILPENVSYGFSVMSYPGAKYIYPADEDGKYNPESETQKPGEIFYIYTTPAYYDNTNMVAGEISGYNEVMFSKALATLLGFETPEELVEANITIDIDLTSVAGIGLKTSDIDESNQILGDDGQPLLDSEGQPLHLVQYPKVSGIIDVTAMFENFPVMYVNYDYFQTIIRYVNQYKRAEQEPLVVMPSAIYIKTDSERTTDFIKAHISEFGDFSGSVEQQLAGLFNEMLSTFSISLAIIAGISLVVATIMILVVLYMSVTERTREIGVLKSIGARRKDIKRIFSSESFLIGLLSGIVGIVLSLLVGGGLMLLLQSLLGASVLSFRWWYFVGALGVSIVISVLAGLYPAAKAAKLDPVESLRHE